MQNENCQSVNVETRRRRWLRVKRGAILTLTLLLTSPAIAHEPARIVVDSIHANNYLHDGLTEDGYAYHKMQGFRRAFEYLAERGAIVEEVKHGRLDAARLAGVKLLFINLVSAERPPFLVSEIAAIRAFIEAGHSLLVITDHSNCYFHAHRLEPLFAELDIASFTDTACDVPPNTIGSGNGWLAITRFAAHPIARDLQWLGMQTGGRVDPRDALAFTSDEAWADRWHTEAYGEEGSPGFYGNMLYSVGEERGRMGVVLAKEFGAGKIVNIADQNMLGDPFLNYADNFRLWLNACAWLLGDEQLADAKRYLDWREKRITFFERRGDSTFGSGDTEQYLNAFTLVSRHRWAFATDRLEDWSDLLIFAHDNQTLSEAEARQCAEGLIAGKRILLLGSYYDSARDESSLTAPILKAVEQGNGEAAVVLTEERDDARIIVSTNTGGRLTILREPGLFQNAFLANPTAKPTVEQEVRGRQLLQAIAAP